MSAATMIGQIKALRQENLTSSPSAASKDRMGLMRLPRPTRRSV
jgi:hypothetical protein